MISPLFPTVAAPDAIVILPLAPELVVPEVKTSWPLAPRVPELTLNI